MDTLDFTVQEGDLVDVTSWVKVRGAGQVAISVIPAQRYDLAPEGVWGADFMTLYGAAATRATDGWVNLRARISVAEQEAGFGLLYRTDPNRCCRMRKVEPLLEGLEPFRLWITGLRRQQSPTRAALEIEETHRLPSGRPIVKLNPLAFWTWRDVLAYCTANDIPLLPLYEQGYVSIGCQPCTAKPADPDNPRSGRWGGAKLECGIHTFDREPRP